MSEEALIKVNSIAKKFSKDFKTSLKYGFIDAAKEIFGVKKNSNLRKTEFWAVKDVSFEVKRGESIGLIGHNGAGKSTLLKMLNGLIMPDEGSIEIRGKVGALIELGAGFNPILTGRENIHINASILGFSKKEIKEKFQSIIDFSEIEEFIDTPVQNYSSGMKVRLGFAIAAQMEPDVLIIDEVLAVGDTGFKIKCFNRIAELKEKCAVIFVSHSMPQISRICSKAIYMKKGRVEYNGDNLTTAIEAYYNSFNTFKNQNKNEFTNVYIEHVNVTNHLNKTPINYTDDLKINLKFKPKNNLTIDAIGVLIIDQDYKNVANSVSKITTKSNNNFIHINIIIPNLQLGIGSYNISLQFFKEIETNTRGIVIENCQNISGFEIVNSPFVTAASFQLVNKIEIVE